MLPQAAERIRQTVPSDAQVLQVAAGEEPLARADWVLDARPYELRGDAIGGRGERFDRRTWIVRDVCGRERWPFEDDRFAFAVCTSLAALRDPVGVCLELSRVARAGYVEIPTVEAELAAGVEGTWVGRSAHRWLCDVGEGELVFTAKPGAVHADPRVRVRGGWHDGLSPEERVHGLFWDTQLPARERLVDGPVLLDELADRVRRRFEPSSAEVALAEARDVGRRVAGFAGGAVARGVGALRGRL